MISDDLKKLIADAINTFDKSVNIEDVLLEHPDDFKNGDYSTPMALVLGKKHKIKPQEIAEKIAKYVDDNKLEEIDKVEVAGVGFINFFLSKKFFEKGIAEIATISNFGQLSGLAGKKVVVDYTDPNPFKQFHIGHLMSNAIGEALCRIMEWNGADVSRICYQGDVGRHVAFTIYGFGLIDKPFPEDSATLSEKTAYLGKAYALGSNVLKDNPALESEVQIINKKIYDRSDEEVNLLYDKGREWSLEHFEEIYEILGTKFDHYFFESQTASVGKKIVEDNIGKVFEESDGAIIFPGEKYGLHTRVFLTKEKLPTYEAKDLGLAKLKYEVYPYDSSIIVTASEQNQYFEVLIKTLSFIFPNIAKTTQHIPHGMMRLPSGKMSSRTGDVITGESMIFSLEDEVALKIKDRNYGEEQSKDIIEKVSVAAIKYSILKQSPGKDIIFDINSSLSFEGDSGPYIQYTYVRAKSVIEKGNSINIENAKANPDATISELEKLLYRLPEIVEEAGRELAPQYIVTYLLNVASAFNSFYSANKILDVGSDTPYRLLITNATTIVLKNGLSILGIKVPERM